MPYFMDVESNKQEVRTQCCLLAFEPLCQVMYSPEFWFSKPGAGAKVSYILLVVPCVY